MTKAGRNDPCPCGSGKKFKKCHGLAGPKKFVASVITSQNSHITNRVSSLISGISSHSTSVNSLKNRTALGAVSSSQEEIIFDEKNAQQQPEEEQKKENFPL